MWDWSAQANSIELLSHLPNWFSAGKLMAFLVVSKLLIVLGAGWVTSHISKRSPNTVIATVLSLAALLIPMESIFLFL